MSAQQPVVRVGVAVIVGDRQGRVILGKRQGSHGAGQWALPGGHVELGETYLQCAERETLEETGLKVRAVRLVAVTEDIFSESKHYITLFVVCERESQEQEPEVLEPHKCDGWFWKGWSELRDMLDKPDERESLFLPIVNLLRKHSDIEALVSTGLGGETAR